MVEFGVYTLTQEYINKYSSIEHICFIREKDYLRCTSCNKDKRWAISLHKCSMV
ncbi:MAG: hypothetical protein LBU60_04125 [Clostridiales bacterium]|nr:hypothetical protein [Clostridiales bacterium]